ncbi:ABC-three component system protein [Pontibacter mangrovi]|uniref:ABC-three component systems C-terminal domain-containing protein n=1 Tax=Pontibacter mangrovi TaxID=2589816 RepID=A0A501W0N0_9BACT|nr:ABC-three component system protein [Pontibacter mangrovi]TPE42165.1 hypothetical protein FJM65_18975 [Pontibacter mangrovi]
MSRGLTDFSAQEPSLGYYYQLRFSLYLLLSNREKINPIIRIENLDDVEIVDINSVNLYQTKLHINSIANLSNLSSDFWKTIRVWSENIANGLVDVDNTIFTLVTTAKISEESFLENLRSDGERNSNTIRDAMLEAISQSTSQTNAKGYAAFLALTSDQQTKLINNIYIIDSAISIETALESIKLELKYATVPQKLDSMIERIEGWWFQKCIHLLTNNIDHIAGKELQLKIDDIRDSFQSDNLPDDFSDPLSIEEEAIENYEHRVFIKQLKAIAIKSNQLKNAINDFRRAYEQRSRWIREELINPSEEDLYESRLYDHWNNIFSAMKDDCDGFTEEQLVSIGKDFYRKYYVDSVPSIKIREKFQSEYMTRGSCQILADRKKIGWHPNFDEIC